MRPSVSINIDRYPTMPMAPCYYPVTYTPTYYPTYYPTYPTYPSCPYSYWPNWSYYYDDCYWWDDYYENPIRTFLKACAVTGVLLTALAIIGAISSH
jgi:hypothetical protein